MGLSVSVYANYNITEDEEQYDFKAFVIDDYWLYKIKNLVNRAYYNADRIYRGVNYSYGNHNRFRETLIRLIDKVEYLDSKGHIIFEILPPDMPFEAFIDFADNEGCLDFEISEIIFNDFLKYNDKAKTILNEYYFLYEIWMKTFEIAKNNKGVVVFN